MFVLDIVQDGLRPVQAFEFSDGLFDVTWAENNENILVAAGGDGSIQIWDVLQPKVGMGRPCLSSSCVLFIVTIWLTTLLLLLLFPVKDWALSECCKSCSGACLRGGHGQCLGCY